MKKTLFLLSSLLLAVVLVGCNLNNVFPTAELNLGLIDGTSDTVSSLSQIEVAVNGASIGVDSVRLKASAKPGSIGAFIDGYAVDYFLANGDQVATSTGDSFKGSLGLYIQDGIECPAGVLEQDCTVNYSSSEGNAVYTQGPEAVSQPFIPIDVDIVDALIAEASDPDDLFGQAGAYAFVVVSGEDANGNPFSQRLGPVTIVLVSN